MEKKCPKLALICEDEAAKTNTLVVDMVAGGVKGSHCRRHINRKKKFLRYIKKDKGNMVRTVVSGIHNKKVVGLIPGVNSISLLGF